jgi:tight adherence protein C
MQVAPPSGPTILGFDVIWIATMLSAVATMAVMLAIYAATTVKDPMARRVKALNERREQLKAGIVASTNKRKKLTNRNQAADNVRQLLSQFKMLQDDQVQKTQMRLMQAGIRTKDLAFFIIFARFILPMVIGIAASLRSTYSATSRAGPGSAATRPSPVCWSAATRLPTSG